MIELLRQSLWFQDRDNLADLAEWLWSHGQLDEANIIDFIRQPHLWSDEWRDFERQKERGNQ